jgi:uncharacterized protein (TIGR02145 family)
MKTKIQTLWIGIIPVVLIALILSVSFQSCQKNEFTRENVILKNAPIPFENPTLYWGLKKFTRETAKPVTETLTISGADLGYFQGCLRLKIKNGNGGMNLVDNALIKIDGETIVSPGDFETDPSLISREICGMSGDFKLEIQLRGEPGGYLEVWIEGTLKPNWMKDQRDGLFYKTVKIGDQIWMAENLKATKLNNGENIPFVTGNAAWVSLTTPGYCWYNNDEAGNKNTYGALYNWYAVNTGKLCPEGWHVPRYLEWKLLEDYLIANEYNYDGSTTGNKIAKSLASTTKWSTLSTDGAPGNNPAANNRSGFTALPGGLRYDNFIMLEGSCEFWSGSENDDNYASGFQIFASSVSSYLQYAEYKYSGFSVRCVRYPDSYLSVVTAPAESIQDISVILGGDAIGGATVFEKGVCYSTMHDPTVGDSKKAAGSGTGYFKVNITGLTPITTYYARAYAVGSPGTIYGNEISFTTAMWKNKYDGIYMMKGYIMRPGDTGGLQGWFKNHQKELATVGPTSVAMSPNQLWADGITGVGAIGQWTFNVIESGTPPYKITVTDPVAANWLMDPTYPNRYDPATKTFYFKVNWGTAIPYIRGCTDTLVYVRSR